MENIIVYFDSIKLEFIFKKQNKEGFEQVVYHKPNEETMAKLKEICYSLNIHEVKDYKTENIIYSCVILYDKPDFIYVFYKDENKGCFLKYKYENNEKKHEKITNEEFETLYKNKLHLHCQNYLEKDSFDKLLQEINSLCLSLEKGEEYTDVDNIKYFFYDKYIFSAKYLNMRNVIFELQVSKIF